MSYESTGEVKPSFNPDTLAVISYANRQYAFVKANPWIKEGTEVLLLHFDSFDEGFPYSNPTSKGDHRPFGEVAKIVKVKDGLSTSGRASIVVEHTLKGKFEMPYFAIAKMDLPSLTDDYMKQFGFILSLASLLLFSSCRRVDSGNVGLSIDQYGDNKGVPVTVVSGTVFYNPWTTDVVEYPAFTQHKEYEPFVVNAKGGTQFTLSKPSLNYRVRRESAPTVYRKYRQDLGDLEDGVIKTIYYNTYRGILNHYTADQVLYSVGEIEAEALDSLHEKLGREGFIVEQQSSGIQPPESYQAAIDAKNKAVQDAQRVENEIQQTRAEAAKIIAKAKGDSADVVIRASATAKGNELLQQSITPLLIEKIKWEKWSGIMPQYQMGSNTTPFIQLK